MVESALEVDSEPEIRTAVVRARLVVLLLKVVGVACDASPNARDLLPLLTDGLEAVVDGDGESDCVGCC